MNHPFLVVAADGAVSIRQRADTGWETRQVAPVGRWPAWNAARGLLALSVAEPGPGSARSMIRMITTAGANRVHISNSSTAAAGRVTA